MRYYGFFVSLILIKKIVVKYKCKYWLLGLAFAVVSCNSKDKENTNQTMLEGKTIMLVDETLKPIADDLVEVFESRYEGKINIVSKSETEVIQTLLKDTSQFAILSRKLTTQEINAFKNKKITPETTPFAIDAIAFIRNSNNNDTLIALTDVIDFLKGQKQTHFKGLVFDNPNSSTVRFILDKAGLKNLPEKDVFSFKTNNEVIKYVAENDNMIGVVGLNYLYQPIPSMQKYLEKINVLSVKDINNTEYFSPTQNNLAENRYPLARELYIVNCQGFPGLGRGFTAFIASDVGQRIVLKSGLLPTNVPPREILVRKKINNEKE